MADIVNEYNNTSDRNIKINRVDVESSSYFDFGKENSEKDSKFEVCDHIRISKYNNYLQKFMSQIHLKTFLLPEKVKNTVPCTSVIEDHNEKKTVLRRKNILREFRVETVIKGKGDILYAK